MCLEFSQAQGYYASLASNQAYNKIRRGFYSAQLAPLSHRRNYFGIQPHREHAPKQLAKVD